MSKCVVTGAAGFIGSHLAEALVGRGHSVVGIDCFTDYYPRKTKVANLTALRKMKKFRFVEMDLASADPARVLQGVDYVFHLAAQPGVRASWGKSFAHYVRDNIVATQRLLEAVKGRSVKKFIYASSSSVYGDSEELPTREDATPKPVSPYGSTKLASESLCHIYHRNYGVPTVILRYFTVYGPRQRPDMAFNVFISKIAQGRSITIFGDGRQRRDFTFVDDTVAATVLAARSRPGMIYNVGTGTSTALNDVVALIESAIGKRAKVVTLANARGDVRNTSADISRIRRDLGFKAATSIREGLARQVSAQLGR